MRHPRHQARLIIATSVLTCVGLGFLVPARAEASTSSAIWTPLYDQDFP